MLQIYTLPQKTRVQAIHEYEERKLSKTNAYICWFLGFYRAYTEQYLLLVLFRVTAFAGIGIIRWIIDAFNVSNYVNTQNRKLDNELMIKYGK